MPTNVVGPNLSNVDQRTRASRLNNVAMTYIRRWVNSRVPGVATVVLPDGPIPGGPGIVYNLTPGRRVMVTGAEVNIESNSDTCCFEIGYTDGINGTGNFTAIACCKYLQSAAVGLGFAGAERTFHMPIPVRYADGARCITFRVNANDAAAIITCEWSGWDEMDD